MESETVRLNNELYTERPQAIPAQPRLSLRDSGLMHLFNELDIEARQSLIDYLSRMGLVKESGMLVIPASRHYFYDADDLRDIRTVITLRQLNHIRDVKGFMKQIISLLPAESDFIGCFTDNRSQGTFYDKSGTPSRQQAEKAEAYENGIESRIPFINRMYSIIDLKTNRYLTRKMVKGLISEVGLEMVNMAEVNGVTYFHARKGSPTA